jgi:hypothetical protein
MVSADGTMAIRGMENGRRCPDYTCRRSVDQVELNDRPGTATVSIHGKSVFRGVKTVTFNIA